LHKSDSNDFVKEMIVSVHQPQYLPWLGFFHKIIKSDCFVFLDKVQYKHREFQNRNKIRTKDGWMWLTVPVVTKGLGRQNISEVSIDNSFVWQESHFRSLRAWYGNAVFFKDYISFFEDVYTRRKWDKLVELNVYITKYFLKELKIDKPVYFEKNLGTTKTATDRIIEICKKLNADTYLSGEGGKDYLEEEKFNQEGIGLAYQNFTHPAYNQCFARKESEFIPYMSAIDLLFNEGPKSGEMLGIEHRA